MLEVDLIFKSLKTVCYLIVFLSLLFHSCPDQSLICLQVLVVISMIGLGSRVKAGVGVSS